MSDQETVAKWLEQYRAKVMPRDMHPYQYGQHAKELLALIRPGEPVGCQWFCHECNDGRMEDYWPTHCPTCMAKDLKTEDLYLAAQTERDQGSSVEFGVDETGMKRPLTPPQPGRKHKFGPWMVSFLEVINEFAILGTGRVNLWDQDALSQIAAAIQDILGGEDG